MPQQLASETFNSLQQTFPAAVDKYQSRVVRYWGQKRPWHPEPVFSVGSTKIVLTPTLYLT